MKKLLEWEVKGPDFHPHSFINNKPSALNTLATLLLVLFFHLQNGDGNIYYGYF